MKTILRFMSIFFVLNVRCFILAMEHGAEQKQLVLRLNGGYVGKKLVGKTDEGVINFAQVYQRWEDGLPVQMKQSVYDSQLLEQFINATKVGLSSQRVRSMYANRRSQDIAEQILLVRKGGMTAVTIPELSLFGLEFLKEKIAQEKQHPGTVPELQELYHHAIAQALEKNTHLPSFVIKRIEAFEIACQQVGAEKLGKVMDGVIDGCKDTPLGQTVGIVERLPEFLQKRILSLADRLTLSRLESLIKGEDIKDDPAIHEKLEALKTMLDQRAQSDTQYKTESLISVRQVVSFFVGGLVSYIPGYVSSWWSKKKE